MKNPETPEQEIDPGQLAQWEAFADAHEAEERAKAEERARKRRVRDGYYFAQGLAVGIGASVILMVLAWSLWP